MKMEGVVLVPQESCDGEGDQTHYVGVNSRLVCTP